MQPERLRGIKVPVSVSYEFEVPQQGVFWIVCGVFDSDATVAAPGWLVPRVLKSAESPASPALPPLAQLGTWRGQAV